ncbi:MAG: radical SAM protein [bacterium]
MSLRPAYTYGPVPSRRLGRSLGVSVIPPKTCSYSCVYCQLGRTDRLRVKRKSFFGKEAVLSEIMEQVTVTEMDYITFAGDGEPTLSSDLGWLIRESRKLSDLPVAVITNGSLLGREDVKTDLVEADIVLPSLDAGSDRVFKAINRPHGTITFDAMVRGMIDFRREYTGRIWLEVMLVHGLNDSDEALGDISHIAEQLKPDRIYLTTPIRPPAESWVKSPPPQIIIKAQEIIGKAVVINEKETGDFSLEMFEQAEEAILEIGSRHPLRMEQAIQIEEHFHHSGIVDSMISKRRLVKVTHDSNTYLLPAHFIRSQ